MSIEEIIKKLEAEKAKHQSEITRIDNDISVLSKYKNSDYDTGIFLPSKDEHIRNGKGTFADIVLSFLKGAGVVKSGRDIFEYFKNVKDKPDYKYKSFSAQLSMLKPVIGYDIGRDIQYYGLKEWSFPNALGKLKDEYHPKNDD